jgi:hypothetical protein
VAAFVTEPRRGGAEGGQGCLDHAIMLAHNILDRSLLSSMASYDAASSGPTGGAASASTSPDAGAGTGAGPGAGAGAGAGAGKAWPTASSLFHVAFTKFRAIFRRRTNMLGFLQVS